MKYLFYSGTGSFPTSQLGPSFGRGGNDEELQIIALDAIASDTIRLVFNIPTLMVGLQGRVKLLYRKYVFRSVIANYCIFYIILIFFM